MKKQFFAGMLCLLLLLSGCAGQKNEAPGEILFSNLADAETRQEVQAVMTAAGIADERQQVFFDHVDQINAVMKPEELTAGWEVLEAEPNYDPYTVQDRWMEQYPDFMGYNCRITAFSLFGDRVTAPAEAEKRELPILFDLSSLDYDPSAFPGQEDSFAVLYSAVPTDDSRNAEDHVQALQQDWKARGIVFRDDPKVRLISFVIHDMIDASDASLFIGHTGLLFPTEDALYFVEKLAFQEPYQCIRFHNREELNAYLMGKYDLDQGQSTAAPFLLENDRLMEGWKRLGTQ